MWLADPTPSPSPINVNVTVNTPPDTTLDNATLALANYTRDLAQHTQALADYTRELTIATGALAVLTLGTLIFFGIQIMSSIRASRPRLEPRSGGGNIYVWPRQGLVTYIAGSDPAFNVEVWVQTADDPNEFSTCTCSTLTPSRESVGYETGDVNQDVTTSRWPFRETDPSSQQCIPRTGNEWFIGLTWSDKASRQYRALWKTLVNLDDPRLVLSEQPRRRLHLPLRRGLVLPASHANPEDAEGQPNQ